MLDNITYLYVYPVFILIHHVYEGNEGDDDDDSRSSNDNMLFNPVCLSLRPPYSLSHATNQAHEDQEEYLEGSRYQGGKRGCGRVVGW